MDYRSILPTGDVPLTDAQGTILVILVLWSLIWKGVALWKAARREDKAWYVVLLVLNTLGILEIIYTFIIARGKKEKAA